MARNLYVHVPFCAHRCGYCDFVTVVGHEGLHGRYVDAVERELQLRGAGDEATFETIFVGGGTPTLVGPALLERLLGRLRSRLAPGGELTVECNPETVTPELAAVLAAGATRVSLGAQSLSPHVLEALERRASPEVVRAAARELRAAGIDRLNLDLIWAAPGQSPDDLERDLAGVLALEPDHVSAYELEFKPGTRLARAHPRPADVLDARAEDDYYDLVVDRLEAGGLDWYETANFAREGQQCRHNLAIWHGEDYLGVGVGAVGTAGLERRSNLPNVVRYVDALERSDEPPARIEQLTGRERREELVMLALRVGGPVRITGADLADGIVDAGAIEELVGHGLLHANAPSGACGDVQVELTRRGRMLLNSVLGRLLAS